MTSKMRKNRSIYKDHVEKAGWRVTAVRGVFAKSAERFLEVRKTKKYLTGSSVIRLGFHSGKVGSSKLSLISLQAFFKNDAESFKILFSSDSKNQTVYEKFKDFGKHLGLDEPLPDYGCNSPLTLDSKELSSATEVEKFIEKIEIFEKLPPIIKHQLKMACGLPITNTEALSVLLQKEGLAKAKQFIQENDPCADENDINLLIADTYFSLGDLENAIEIYQDIPEGIVEYQKAQYQIASILFNNTDSSDYANEREHAKACLPYYARALDYQDSADLCRKIFACLCTGSYKNLSENFPYPAGAKLSTIFELADLIYANRILMSNLSIENEQLRKNARELSPHLTQSIFSEKQTQTESVDVVGRKRSRPL